MPDAARTQIQAVSRLEAGTHGRSTRRNVNKDINYAVHKPPNLKYDTESLPYDSPDNFLQKLSLCLLEIALLLRVWAIIVHAAITRIGPLCAIKVCYIYPTSLGNITNSGKLKDVVSSSSTILVFI